MQSGYYRDDFENHIDNTKDLCLNSVGHYRMLQTPKYHTTRTHGREDFHLLYLTAGKAHIMIDWQFHELLPGQFALYYPNQHHEYSYYLKETPDVYWMHFTGKQVEPLLQELGFYQSGIWSAGTRNRYTQLFEEMIGELQLKKSHFLEIANSHLGTLLYQLQRGVEETNTTKHDKIVEQTLQHFYKNYSQPFSVEDWAKQLGISPCWFIRNFKEATGDTPLSYLTTLRIRKSQELLENNELSVGQISELVGYSNPFYFTRQFKKITSIPPSQYRKNRNPCT